MTQFWESLLYTSLSLLLLVTIGFALMQFSNYRNIKKRKTFFEKLHNELKPGVKVSFSNGLFGTIRRIDEETADIEVKSGAVITVSRYAISSIEQ